MHVERYARGVAEAMEFEEVMAEKVASMKMNAVKCF
jgi:hypothetical protein